MDEPAKTSAGEKQRRRGTVAVSSRNERGKQNQNAVGGASVFGGMSSAQTVFFSSPSSAGNTCPLPAPPCVPSQCGASASVCNSENGSKSPCWTFLPVGGLEAKKRKRALAPKHSAADGVATSVAPPCTEILSSTCAAKEGPHLPVSQGEQVSQSPSLCRPPTFEQLLCLSTDDEKDVAAAALQCTKGDASPATAPSDGSFSKATASQSFEEKQVHDVSYLAPRRADSDESPTTSSHTAGSLQGWQNLHVERPDVISKHRQIRTKIKREASARGCYEGSCVTNGAAAEVRKETWVLEVPSDVRRLRFHPDTVVPTEEDGWIANASLQKHKCNVQTREKVEFCPFLSMPPTRRTHSPDVKRVDVDISSYREASEMKQQTANYSKKWTAAAQDSKDGSGDRSAEGRPRSEVKIEKRAALCKTGESGGSGGHQPQVPAEECNDNEQERRQAVRDTDGESKARMLTDDELSGLCRTPLQVGRLGTSQKKGAEFFAKAGVPRRDSFEVTFAAPSEEHKKREGRQSRAERHQTRGSRARSCSSRCLRGGAAAETAGVASTDVQQQVREQALEKHSQETPEAGGQQAKLLVCKGGEAHLDSGVGPEESKAEGSGSETGTEGSLEKRPAGKRDEKEESDAERGYDGGSSGHERQKERRTKSGKKHRRNKEASRSRADGRKRSTRRSSDSTAAPAAPKGHPQKGESKEEQHESLSLTIPPHPLFIPALRLSLSTRRRKGRAIAPEAVLNQQRPSDGSETPIASGGSRTVASTCVASHAACGIFAAESSENEDADDDTASVRRERSLLSCLFTLPSISSPSRKQELRRTINRYAVFKLCSDNDTTSSEEEEERKIAVVAAADPCEKQERQEGTCAAPHVEPLVETKTRRRVKSKSQSASTASLSSFSDKPPGKTKRVRLRLRADEERSFVTERRGLRSARRHRNCQGKHRRVSTSSSTHSDICLLRFPVRAAAAEHFSEDFSSDSTPPQQACSAAERLYSPLEPVMKLKKPGCHFAADTRLAKRRQSSKTAAFAARSCAALSLISSNRVEEIDAPSSSEAAALSVTKEAAVSQTGAARSPASDVHVLPADTDTYKLNAVDSANVSRTRQMRHERVLPRRTSNAKSLDEVSCASFQEQLLKENAFPSQTRKNFLRRPPGKSRAKKHKRTPPSSYSSTSSTSSRPENQRQSHYLQQTEHTVRRRNCLRGRFHSIKEQDRRETTNSLRRATRLLADKACVFPRNYCPGPRLPACEAPTVAAPCGFVATASASTEEEGVTTSISSSCASVASLNTAMKATCDRTAEVSGNARANDCMYQSHSTPQQQESPARLALRERTSSESVWLAPKRQRQQRVRKQERYLQRSQLGGETSEEAWEDLGAPNYSTQDKEKCNLAGDAGTVPAKRERGTCSGRHQDAGETHAQALQELASRLIQDVASLSNRPRPSAQQQNSSSDAAPEGRRSAPAQECERLLSSSESGGSSEAEIPAAFDTLWKGSFRCALQTGVRPQDCISTVTRDPFPNFVDAGRFPVASCMFAGALHATDAGCVKENSAGGQ